jgi:membrane protein required for colicin V production
MNWLDPVIVLVVAWFAVNAFRAGIIREVVTLIGLVVGIVAAGLYYDSLAQEVLLFIDNEVAARALGFVLLLGSLFLMGQLVAYLLRGLASLLMLGWADQLLGLAFGVLKGLLLVQALLILFVTYPQLGLDKAVEDSALAPHFLDSSRPLLQLLPDEFSPSAWQVRQPPAAD